MQSISFIQEIQVTDLKACKNADTFLQSAMWGEFKSRFDWKAKAFQINWSFNGLLEKTVFLALCRRFALNFELSYVPWGPQLPTSFPADVRTAAIGELAQKLKPFFARNTVFIRFEPPWGNSSVMDSEQSVGFLSAGFKTAAAAIQAPDTVIINLDASCDEILAQMKPKWRYNISLASRKGVQINTENETDKLEIFYNLLKETAQRDKISIHSFNYYKTLFELCKIHTDSGIQLRLYTALHENDALAAIIVLFYGQNATYLYGASSNNKRNLMAPYALQWKAMLDAKEAGCQHYDLFGISPNDDPNHPMSGLYRFKTGFGGQIVHRTGGWDYPYKPLFYNMFRIAEDFRKKIRLLRN
jgi:lipid II:glycine glycyltransferase (peptidoglycan interpeptide bridge formation enzyme)